MAKIKKNIKKAWERVNTEIKDFSLLGWEAAGVASEGYAGGYRDALDDVLLAMNGVKPNRHFYWGDWEE
jgi:hypothetical protein